GGWIELAECYNVSIKNVESFGLNATISAAGLIKSSGVGPDNCTIENVYWAGSIDDTESIEIKADYLTIRNSNVPITIAAGSTYIDLYNISSDITLISPGIPTNVQLFNCSGTLTDPVGVAVQHINGTVYKPFIDQGSAAELNLPLLWGENFNVTGTINITSIAAADSISGRTIFLKFEGILTFTDGSNLKLEGDFVTTADDTITLFCDGTDWYEKGRSVN
ncbi:MAG: hypothetical protein KKD18_03260, partial [Nanoarchaeota archaeon]|nr:hypothetical protein [Nanoarchaeota archaeon]